MDCLPHERRESTDDCSSEILDGNLYEKGAGVFDASLTLVTKMKILKKRKSQ